MNIVIAGRLIVEVTALKVTGTRVTGVFTSTAFWEGTFTRLHDNTSAIRQAARQNKR